MARPKGTKYIETPEKMWELFKDYVSKIRENPIQIVEQKKGNSSVKIIVQKGAATPIIPSSDIVSLPARRPLTMEGFENYVADLNITQSLDQYFTNQGGLYADYMGICSRIKREIRQDQIEGGMVGIYNPSITQRLNGLVEKTENKHNHEVEIFKGLDLDVKEDNSSK